MTQTKQYYIDESKLNFENLDSLDHRHKIAFKKVPIFPIKKFKEENFPCSRQYAFIAYNVIVGIGCYQFTKKYKQFAKKFVKPTGYSLTELLKYGTFCSTIFVGSYLLGTAVVTGIYNPIKYINSLMKIEGSLIDIEIRYDSRFQKVLLFDLLEYFKIDQNVIKSIKDQLDRDKSEYVSNNPDAFQYFGKNNSLNYEDLDDDDDEEEEESKENK